MFVTRRGVSFRVTIDNQSLRQKRARKLTTIDRADDSKIIRWTDGTGSGCREIFQYLERTWIILAQQYHRRDLLTRSGKGQ